MTKIADNPSMKNLLEPLQLLISLETSSHAPLTQLHNEAVKIASLPDQFNKVFADKGWIAYESMCLDTMERALATEKNDGLAVAEDLLVNYYNEDILNVGIKRFYGHPKFYKRMRLVELAKVDYLAERYHACIPLLLALLDGIVNDVSGSVGFFAEKGDLKAFDSIAGHHSGLAVLAKIMSVGRNKTNENSINIPFRNGILHGRDLAFDTRLVAAKCWGTLFAARDWAGALADSKAEEQSEVEIDAEQLIEKVTKTSELQKAIEDWKPRVLEELTYLPHASSPISLPVGTPERFVAEFMENWCKNRFNLMGEALLYLTDVSPGKKAGRASKDFGGCKPITYSILNVKDESAAVSLVETEIIVKEKDHSESTVRINISLEFSDINNNLVVRTQEGGRWKIIQNSFRTLIYK
jgi:hypothetical protein